MSITWKVVCAVLLVVLVSLGLGLWSLRASARLHDLAKSLLNREIPASRIQLALSEQVPRMVRYAYYAVVLRDPAYDSLHRERAQEFREGIRKLSDLLPGSEKLAQVQIQFAEYLKRVEQQRAASHDGRAAEALRVAEGPTRQVSEALLAALERLWHQSQGDLERTRAAAAELEGTVRTTTLASIGLMLLTGLGAVFLVAIQITAPIRALKRATQVVARGEYDVPLVATSRNEIGDLARSFREMAEELAEVDTLKREFFYSLSHEFRSPLMSITMAASLLERETLNRIQQRWLAIIRHDAQKLYRLVNQIQDLAKERSGTLRLDCAVVEVRQIAESAVRELQPLADAKRLTIAVDVPRPSPKINCDEGRIQQVLSNLLSNAVKFTPAGGRIHVSAREQGRELMITVEDSGMGIPARDLPRIFDPYHQSARTRGGTGLGLSIVRAFVEAHGGRVWVDSREGAGSRFHIALPRKHESDAAWLSVPIDRERAAQ